MTTTLFILCFLLTTTQGNPKLSKKALTLQVAQLEQELKLVKFKAATLAEQNEDLKRQVEATEGKIDNVESTQLQALETENKKLKQELDSYITKKWRDFCAVQESPTPYKKRLAYSNRDNE
jgi:hypothetical protein